MTDDLVSWLLARLDEDEQIAQRADRDHERAVREFLASRPEDDPPAADERAEIWDGGTNEEDSGRYYAGVWAAAGTTRVAELDEAHTSTAAHIARHDPARVLAEVAATRRIISEHGPYVVDATMTDPAACRVCVDWDEAGYDGPPPANAPCLTLRLLALPKADMPGYRDDWRP